MTLRNLIICFIFIAGNLTHAASHERFSTAAGHWGCGTQMLLNAKTSHRPVGAAPQLPNLPAAPAPDVHLGKIERFFTHIPEQLVKGTCIAIGENIYLYIENSVKHMMTIAEAREIIAEFDSRIYPQVHRWIGFEWRPGLDLDTKITLLMHDVGANNSGEEFGGYFSPADQDPTALNSNRREIVYMDIFQFKERSRYTFYNSLAHEFAHLVNWYQNGGTSDERWIEEGIASFVEWAIYRNIHNIFVDGYLKDPTVSLTSENSFETYYGASFMLLLYLFELHGGERFIREFARQDLLGIRGIDATLALLGRQERFAEVFQNWALANYVNNISRGRSLGYRNLQNRRVVAPTRQVSSYPNIQSINIENWGVRYIVFRNLPDRIEIALDGTGDGKLHAKLALLPSNGTASVHSIDFDEKNNGMFKLDNLNPRDRVVLMVTSTTSQSFRFAASIEGASGINVGPPRPLDASIALPETTTHAIGSHSQPSHRRSNIDFRLEPVSQIHLSSNYQDLVVRETLIYAVSDWGLEILDLETPARPRAIGQIATPGNANGITVEGEMAYVADGAAGVTLIDVQRPDEPRLVKTVGDFESARRIKIANGNVYIVDIEDGLRIYNQDEFLNLLDPQPIGTFETGGVTLDVSVDGDTVYLSNNHAFQILDFGFIDIPAFAGIVDIRALDFEIVDGYAYAASGNMHIVDVRDRLNPKALSSIQTPGWTTGIKIHDGYAYLTDLQTGLYVIDVRNRHRPRTIAIQPTLGDAMGIDLFESATNGMFGYIADGNHGLQVIDLGIPSQPRWLHRYDASGDTHGMHIVQSEDGNRIAYIAGGTGGLKIVELKGAFDAAFNRRIPIMGVAADVRVEAELAFVAAGESGLIVIDLGNLNNPRMVSHIETSSPAWGLEIRDGYVFLCADQLIVVDSREPMQSRVVARRTMPGSAYRISIVENLGYVAALNGGLHIYDLENPANPRAIGSYQAQGSATNITVSGNRGYLLDTLAGVQILDLSNPRRPDSIAEYQTDALPISAQIRGDYLYLLDQERVQIVDVRNRNLVSRPNFEATLQFPSELAVIGETIYVADRYDLRMFKINEHLFELSVEDPTVFQKPPSVTRSSIALYTNRLGQNFPNPFNPETWIPYEIESGAYVTIQIFDNRGLLIRQLDMGHQKAGEYVTRANAVYWDGRNEVGEPISSGIYFYQISAGDFISSRKMAILK
ncbi:MAG: T9SS type A sorting domain-containing protein [Candidatus Poribacteria bacterium]|nr:T9SS type A sorting domain-containing protein [Candidatus Poribacteria bacterium]